MHLIKLSVDRTTLLNDMIDDFKKHLRILHTNEDDMISLYLGGAIEAISIYADQDIYKTDYEYFYNTVYDYRYPSNITGWYCKRVNLLDVVILDGAGIDVTSNFKVDKLGGMIYPHPAGNDITFSAGFATAADVPLNLKNIIFRYAASLFEDRQSIRVGEPKLLPDWLTHALASVWIPRV